MTTKEFWMYNNLSGDVEIQESPNKYNESDVNIRYIRLSRPVDGQDYLVLSLHATEARIANTTKFVDMQVTKGDNGMWGIIMPDTNKVVEKIKLF